MSAFIQPSGGISSPDLPALTSWVALFEANRQTPVADATAISTLADSSGNARNATQTGSARPIYKIGSNGINGQPVVRFAAASSQFMTTAAGGQSMTGDWYMGAVLRFTTNGNDYQTALAFGEEGSGQRREMLKYNSGFSGKIGFNGQGADLPLGGIPIAGTPCFVEIIRASGVVSVYFNGVLETSGSPSLSSFASGVITLGANNAGGENLNADLALALFAGTALDDGTISKIRGYVFAIYGISLEGSAAYGFSAKYSSGLPVLSSLYDNGQDLGFYGRRLYGVTTASGLVHILKSTQVGQNVLIVQNKNPAGFSVVHGKGHDVPDSTEGYGTANGWGNSGASPLAFRAVGFWEIFNGADTSFYAARIIQTNSVGNYRRFETEETSGDLVFYARDVVYPGETELLRIKSSGVLNIKNCPTSASGKVSGDIYSNAGILTIVP